LANLDRHEEAAEALRVAESLDSTSPEACLYLAESLRKAERYEESIPFYQRMLQVAAEYPQAVHGYGKSLLALGKLGDGWDAMEFRFASSCGTWTRHALPNWSPQEDGEAGKNVSRVLAYSEEGIGAELMFASCLPDMINSVEHCVVECESSLHSLFRRSFPRAEFVPLADDDVHSEGNPWGISLDAQIAFGSLPRYFRRSAEDFPLRKTYLVPDKELVAQWSTRLAGLGDAKKIGVLWNGIWTEETPKQTSLPLQELRGLMSRYQGAAWICLQHGAHQNDMNQQRGLGSVSPRIFPEAFRYNLDMMAALLTALDLVITPPGYIAHLAGALGVRTWLLLPAGADWRHSIDTVSLPRSVWHPSIIMYRQAKTQTWQHFFSTLGNDLEKFLTTYRPPENMPATLTFNERSTVAVPKVA
jgi:tetratricopeptide (TPR) repeat protein